MSGEVVKWEDKMREEARIIAGSERPRVGKISFKSGQMAYEKTPIPGNKLTCIILASAFEHAYYDKPYDPNNIATPVCFALSQSGEDMIPHVDSPLAQGDSCLSCAKFAWGSDPKGGRGKACKEGRRIVVMPVATDMKAEDVAKAEMAFFKVPVMSIKNWANYVNLIAANYNRPPWGVITEVSVIPDMKSQFQVKFAPMGVVAEEVLGSVYGKTAGAVAVAMQPYEAQPEGASQEAPAENTKYSKKK